MLVQDFLRAATGYNNHIDVLDFLEMAHGVKYNIWEDLVVLNYDQIEGDKFNPLAMECRSLVLYMGDWSVVSRSFDRFFNLTEDPTAPTNITDMVCYEKIDGSLIGFFRWQGNTLYRTRKMIMPDTIINGNPDGYTWAEAIETAGEFVVPTFGETIICELTCRWNRVVTMYDPQPDLYLLATRKHTGEYGSALYNQTVAEKSGLKQPKAWRFNTFDIIKKSAESLRDLQEGYVMYLDGVPQIKVKNPAYVAAHHLRGEGVLSEKRVMDLILMAETDEYLAIFPEDSEVFTPYMEAYDSMVSDLWWWRDCEIALHEQKSQKDFAMIVKDLPIAALVFKMRKNDYESPNDLFRMMTTPAKYRMILAYKEGATL